jgi:hypothetical protein
VLFSYDSAEAMLTNAPPPCGPRRLQLWKSLLLTNTPPEVTSCQDRVSIEDFDRFNTLCIASKLVVVIILFVGWRVRMRPMHPL